MSPVQPFRLECNISQEENIKGTLHQPNQSEDHQRDEECHRMNGVSVATVNREGECLGFAVTLLSPVSSHQPSSAVEN